MMPKEMLERIRREKQERDQEGTWVQRLAERCVQNNAPLPPTTKPSEGGHIAFPGSPDSSKHLPESDGLQHKPSDPTQRDTKGFFVGF